jgi:hypothetical protein
MPTARKSAPIADWRRKPRKIDRARPLNRHPVAFSRGEKHIGATEDQVSVTMPSKGDDDEPKRDRRLASPVESSVASKARELRVHRRDRLGGVIHKYDLAA